MQTQDELTDEEFFEFECLREIFEQQTFEPFMLELLKFLRKFGLLDKRRSSLEAPCSVWELTDEEFSNFESLRPRYGQEAFEPFMEKAANLVGGMVSAEFHKQLPELVGKFKAEIKELHTQIGVLQQALGKFCSDGHGGGRSQ